MPMLPSPAAPYVHLDPTSPQAIDCDWEPNPVTACGAGPMDMMIYGSLRTVTNPAQVTCPSYITGHRVSRLPCRKTFPWSLDYVTLHHSTCPCGQGDFLVIGKRAHRRWFGR